MMFCASDLFQNNQLTQLSFSYLFFDCISHQASSHPALYIIAQNKIIFVIFWGNSPKLVTKPTTNKLLTTTNHTVNLFARYVHFLLKSCQNFRNVLISGTFSVILTWPVKVELKTMSSRDTFLLLTYVASLKSRDKITLLQARKTVPLQTWQDAPANVSSIFAFGFSGFGFPGDKCYFYSSR